ncbi:DUF3168 domain-containing protein [Pararhizobium mangrovi]|uniref:DUF3168 domain-containing protein n=1 Tax=Pararhizobium mangrovi TaxID=2590452 RepID=A0A506TY12_9HYPH|nr:DUF3168 domain-containing protein [Pararhizobium mangrovi]TPW26390.1 DUF3168 domain-containing protein [Pararhizobium mangrovi]
MREPTVALAAAIRSRLIADPAVTALVAPDLVRAGSTRPDRMPTIILASGQTIFLGNAAGSQLVATVYLNTHIWALEDGAETAKAIGFAVMNALRIAPASPDFVIDEWEHLSVRWMRDPDPAQNLTHGVMTVEATMRWAADGSPIGGEDAYQPAEPMPDLVDLFNAGLR